MPDHTETFWRGTFQRVVFRTSWRVMINKTLWCTESTTPPTTGLFITLYNTELTLQWVIHRNKRYLGCTRASWRERQNKRRNGSNCLGQNLAKRSKVLLSFYESKRVVLGLFFIANAMINDMHRPARKKRYDTELVAWKLVIDAVYRSWLSKMVIEAGHRRDSKQRWATRTGSSLSGNKGSIQTKCRLAFWTWA